ncbi:hypothetical protein CS344_20140 [Bordetella bronchiseptica]|uniref:hypothetical protein n=1 Tax=Bordetella bronchiseptica TaxID=518 RepID=UPI000FD912B7|nr:hypothetical protein [Bordetella bronchiseptica]AZW14226.1 hypothetical protein CS344_20140 [Bordetella bronchiseptica]QBS70762.1 hypothetical protein B2C13_19830 [Bordetella bronchiseptica]
MQLTESKTSLGALVVSEMRLMYGAKFGQQWQGLTPRELKDSWDQKLTGMTEAEIRAGLVACLSRDWPPTVPEFLRMCRPWMSPEVAYHEAVHGMSCRRRGEMGNWSHPAIYWAAVATGPHDLLNSTYGSIKQRWGKSFSDELSKGNWPDIPPVRSALPAPGQTMATKAEAAAALQRMGAAKALEESGRNPKRWIDKWQQRIKNGERPSPAIAAMLKRAMEEA